MQTKLRFTVVLAAVVILLSCQPTSEPVSLAQGPTIADLQAQGVMYMKALEAGDAATLAGLFTEDAIMMPREEPAVRGRKAIQDYWTDRLASASIKLDTRTEATGGAGALGYGRGTFTAELTPKAGGAPLKYTGKWLNIVERTPEGDWKMSCQTWNSDHAIALPPT